MSIIVNMACGLANRMFQYSYYLYLKSRGMDVLVDYYSSAKLAHEVVSWNRIFPKAVFDCAPRRLVWITGGGGSLPARLRRKFLPATCSILQADTSFDAPMPKDKAGNQYVIGVFQNAAMVKSVEKELLEKLCFEEIQGEKNLDLVAEIANCESVAIHVRKGSDYSALDWYRNTCPEDYYQKAVEYIKGRVSSPKFYVFADNPDWVREHFSWLEYTLVDWNPTSGYGSHYDMQLMSMCKHNVISNSTFSWWGAFLNRYPSRIIVAPKFWFNPNGNYKEVSSERVVCPDWIVL